MKQVALIAGMGPEAGADVLTRFLRACRRQMQASGVEVLDQSYPPHILVQYPVPDRTAALLHGGASPLPGLASAFAIAKASGARVCAIACNTAHFWYPELRNLFPELEILHIAEETARVVKDSGARTCAVMATSATIQKGLYSAALQRQGVACPTQFTADDEAIHRAIFQIKAGNLEDARRAITQRLDVLLQRADAVILGCTELGLVVQQDMYAGRVTDAADVLAHRLAAKAYDTCEAELPLKPHSMEPR